MATDYAELAIVLVILYAAVKYKDQIVTAINNAIGQFNTGGGIAPTPAPGGLGGQIYPCSGQPCTQTSGGESEQGGDRKEPQVECGQNFLNADATVYIRTSGTINDTLSVKHRGPRHGGGVPESDMCNNIHYINLGSNSTAAFGKQAGHTAEYCEFSDPIPAIPSGVWVGVKTVEWNEGSGVHFQTWLDNPEGSGWKLVADAVDNGGSGSCQGPASAPYTVSPCAGSHPVSIGFRVDGLSGGGDVEFKNISVCEITPGAPTTAAYAKQIRAYHARKRKMLRIYK